MSHTLVSNEHALEPAAESAGGSRRLGQVLRLVGAAFLLASAATFLLHRWEQGSDLMRYGTLLLHTVLLVVAALFCGLHVKESRGARTFLGIALATVPINTAVLGGLVYSRFAWDAGQVTPAGEFVWIAPSATAALVCVALSALVLGPVTWLALRTLAKPRSGSLLLAYGASNALLVVPWRIPEVSAALLVLACAGLVVADARHFRRHPAMTTPEGWLARAALLLPLALLVGRGLHLYSGALSFLGGAALAAGLVLASFSTPESDKESRTGLNVGAAMALCAGWTALWSHACDTQFIRAAATLPSLLLPVSATLLVLSRGLGQGRAIHHALAALLALCAVVPNLWLFPGLGTLLGCASVGAAVLAYGAAQRSKLLVAGGIVAVASASVYQVTASFRVGMLTHWVSLSTLGILLVVAASYWERHQVALLRRLRRWQAAARRWDY